MSHINVPDMSIARGTGLGPPPGHIAYQGGPLVAVAPPPQMPLPERGKKQRVFGIVPAAPGAQFALVREDAPKDAPTPRDIMKARAALRTATAQQAAAEAAWSASATTTPGGRGDEALLKAASEAGNRTAMMRRTLAEMEALGAGKPIRVEMATVREPAEVADRLADAPPQYVCMHDGCKGKTWDSEADFRRAHPTHQEMMRSQQCHVFAILCDAPLDPADPHGERVGYVAPKGSDGTTVASAIVQAEEEDRTAEKVADLETKIRDLTALVEALTKGAKK